MLDPGKHFERNLIFLTIAYYNVKYVAFLLDNTKKFKMSLIVSNFSDNE
jgi:hypothetical protein